MGVSNVIIFSVITNVGLVIIKLIAGVLGSSHALIADGIHSFSDLITDFVALIGGFLSQKPPDDKHPFGHKNIEYVTSFFISIVILGIGISIIRTSFTTQLVIPSFFVIGVSLFTVICKFILARFLLMRGKQLNNQILIASGQESHTDVISSCIVFFSSFLIQFSKQVPLFKFADKVAAVIVGIFVIKIGTHIFRENLSFIIGEQERDSSYLEKLQHIVLHSPSVKKISNFILLKYGNSYRLTGTILMDEMLSLREAHTIIDEIEHNLSLFDSRICYITLHFEPFTSELDIEY